MNEKENNEIEKCNREILHERELREQWQKGYERTHTQWENAHERFHTLDKEALILARDETERRLTDMQITVNDMQVELKILEASKSNIEGRMWAMGAGITVLAIGVPVLLHYLR